MDMYMVKKHILRINLFLIPFVSLGKLFISHYLEFHQCMTEISIR